MNDKQLTTTTAATDTATPLRKSMLFGWWPNSSKLEKNLRRIFAFLFWFYVTTKLFIYDWDIFLIQHMAPNLSWIIQFKFLLALSTISCILVTTKNARIAAWVIYTSFFPLIFSFWTVAIICALLANNQKPRRLVCNY
jgi:hypothetical protein